MQLRKNLHFWHHLPLVQQEKHLELMRLTQVMRHIQYKNYYITPILGQICWLDTVFRVGGGIFY